MDLYFVLSEGAKEGIPWQFVSDFAELMAEVAELGRGLGEWDQGFWDRAGELGVFVGLRFAGGGAWSGSGSGSSGVGFGQLR